MTTQNKIVVVAGGGLILILLAVFIILPIFLGGEEEPVVEETPRVISIAELQPLPPDQPDNNGDLIVNPINGETVALDDASSRAEVERTTRLFVERFGSYSNFSDFANITSLEGLMTNSMKSYAQTFVESSQDQNQAEYSGVTTRLISLNIDEFVNESNSSVDVVVLEETQDGLSAPIESKYKDGRVEFLYAAGVWLVDGVYYK